MKPLGENPAVLDPRGTLSAGQLSLLRDIDQYGARKVPSGWMVGGFRRRLATVRPLFLFDLLREDFRNGRHTAVLTYAGRLAIERVTKSVAPPARRYQTAD